MWKHKTHNKDSKIYILDTSFYYCMMIVETENKDFQTSPHSWKKHTQEHTHIFMFHIHILTVYAHMYIYTHKTRKSGSSIKHKQSEK